VGKGWNKDNGELVKLCSKVSISPEMDRGSIPMLRVKEEADVYTGGTLGIFSGNCLIGMLFQTIIKLYLNLNHWIISR
jgi:hypothetical protein